MASENKPNSTATNSKKRKQRYRPNNKPVKKKGSYPLHPGVQGFFITCDGGKERQAAHEAINVIDSFYEELVNGKSENVSEVPGKTLNKKIKFTYSDDEEDRDDEEEEDDSDGEEKDEDEGKGKEVEKESGVEKNKSNACQSSDANDENPPKDKTGSPNVDIACHGIQTDEKTNDNDEGSKDHKEQETDAEEPPVKKQCVEITAPKRVVEKVEKSVDKLIEEELKELKDKSKRRFVSLDSGCNGVVFIQMRPRDGDPSPKEIIQHMMTSAAATRKHMSRFILRVIPVEVGCYASEEEITKAIAPVVGKYFPVDTHEPKKFAVLYEARANTGIDRMKIIDSVAKSVPGPHKVDLSNPDRTIVVQIVKTVCLIGVVEKYKELGKYNLRQLTSPQL